MYDETEAKASYPEIVADQTPLERAMVSLHASIEVAGVISEKLGASLQSVLRETGPMVDDNNAKLAEVDMSSAHVRDVLKAQRHVTEVADRLRSLLERIEV